MEWEATGFAGVAYNTDYLVFDPTDSLAIAAKMRSAGKFSGIPCEVLGVLRLENHWYSVVFYTDEAWGQRNTLDCTGGGRELSKKSPERSVSQASPGGRQRAAVRT